MKCNTQAQYATSYAVSTADGSFCPGGMYSHMWVILYPQLFPPIAPLGHNIAHGTTVYRGQLLHCVSNRKNPNAALRGKVGSNAKPDHALFHCYSVFLLHSVLVARS